MGAAMVISCVGLSKRINSLASIALVLYSVILIIMPLTFLHVEDTFSITAFLASQSYPVNLIVLIHEALFAHLRNAADYLYGSLGWLFDQLAASTSERLFLCDSALQLHFLTLVFWMNVVCRALRYVYKRGKALSQTISCFRLFLHSPPLLHSR